LNWLFLAGHTEWSTKWDLIGWAPLDLKGNEKKEFSDHIISWFRNLFPWDTKKKWASKFSDVIMRNQAVAIYTECILIDDYLRAFHKHRPAWREIGKYERKFSGKYNIMYLWTNIGRVRIDGQHVKNYFDHSPRKGSRIGWHFISSKPNVFWIGF
jgi:hypothetical protein